MPSPSPKSRNLRISSTARSVEMAHFAAGFSACPTADNARTGRWWRRERNWDQTFSRKTNATESKSTYERRQSPAKAGPTAAESQLGRPPIAFREGQNAARCGIPSEFEVKNTPPECSLPREPSRSPGAAFLGRFGKISNALICANRLERAMSKWL
jgi:hypothetical protein